MHKPLPKAKIKELNKKVQNQLPENFSLVFLLQDIEDPVNVGSLFRIADGCGAELVLTGLTPKPPEKGMALTSRGMERRVGWVYESNFEDAVNK